MPNTFEYGIYEERLAAGGSVTSYEGQGCGDWLARTGMMLLLCVLAVGLLLCSCKGLSYQVTGTIIGKTQTAHAGGSPYYFLTVRTAIGPQQEEVRAGCYYTYEVDDCVTLTVSHVSGVSDCASCDRQE